VRGLKEKCKGVGKRAKKGWEKGVGKRAKKG